MFPIVPTTSGSSILYRSTRFGCWLFLIVLSLSQSSGFSVQEPGRIAKNLDRDQFSKKVEELSKGLDSNRISERDRAEEQLLDLGVEVLEHLPPVSDDLSPEFLMRLDRVRTKLDSQDEKSVFQPSTVTVRGTMSGLEALQALSESTGNDIQFGDSDRLQRTVSLEYENTPFWEVFDEVLDQLGLTVPAYDDSALELIESDPDSALRISSAAYCGALRLEPIRITKNSNLVSPSRSNLTISLLISWEPRLRPSIIELDPSNLEFKCDSGDLLTWLDESPILITPSAGSQVVVDLECRMPPAQAKSILNWSGQLELVVPGPMASVSFSDLSQASGKKMANGMLAVTVDSVRKNRSVYEVSLMVDMINQSGAPVDTNSITAAQEAVVYDKRSTKIENVGWSSELAEKGQQRFTYLFDFPGEQTGHRLVFRAPGSIRKGMLPFEGGEIPIP